MEIYQLKVFLEVARHLSFTEAADALNLTQPAISAKIKLLEMELGVALFHRLGRKIQLTEVGHFLLEEGPSLVDLELHIKGKIEEAKQGKFASLRIGCTLPIMNGWIPDVAFKYRHRYPTIKTQCFTYESTEFLYRAITDQQVDVGVSEISFESFSEITSTSIDKIYYSLIVSSEDHLASQAWLSLKDLRDRSWVLLPYGSPSRLVFEARLAELGLNLSEFSQVEVVDNLSLMCAYITQGNYLGFASSLDFKTERVSQLLTSIPLQEFALAGNVFLILPTRFTQSTSSSLNQPKRSRAVNTSTPVQKFAALAKSLTGESASLSNLAHSPNSNLFAPLSAIASNHALEADTSLPESSEELAPVRLKSPNLVIRSANTQRSETITLSLGVQNTTIPVVTAGLIIRHLGLLEHFLPRQGRYSSTQFKLQWHNFSSGAPIVEGLHSQAIDIGVLGDYPLILSAIQADASSRKVSRTQLVSFVASNPDGSGSAIVVPHESRLNSLEDLRGGVITLPFRTLAYGMVIRSLYTANLLPKVQLDSLDCNSIDKVLKVKTKTVDAYAHFAPFHEIAIRQQRFRSLFSGNLSGLPAFYGIVIQKSFGEQHPEIVTAYLRALRAAQYWYASTPSAVSLVSKWTGLKPEVISHNLGCFNLDQPSGQFFQEMQIRHDWIAMHISQLKRIPGNEYLEHINLDDWIQTEFLNAARRLK